MITSTIVPYTDGETPLNGILARDESQPGKRPAIVLFHEAPGLADHPKRRIQMLAELGFVAFAADLFGDGQVIMGPGAMERLERFQGTPGLVRRRVKAAYDALAARAEVDAARIAAIGYCMGGACALELARGGARLAGVVSFHGLLATKEPAREGDFAPKVLVCTGAEDPLVPAEQVAAFEDEMRNAHADWQIVTYGGAGHAFTNRDVPPGFRPGFAYQEAADKRSWQAMRNFFDEIFS